MNSKESDANKRSKITNPYYAADISQPSQYCQCAECQSHRSKSSALPSTEFHCRNRHCGGIVRNAGDLCEVCRRKSFDNGPSDEKVPTEDVVTNNNMDEKQNNKDAAVEFSLAQTQQKINDLQIRNDGRTANCIGPNCGDVGLADLKGLCEACYNMLDKYNREKKVAW
jgi:hypothetical protein